MILCIVHLLQLNFGADESYNLTVPTTGDPLYAQIEASKKSIALCCEPHIVASSSASTVGRHLKLFLGIHTPEVYFVVSAILFFHDNEF